MTLNKITPILLIFLLTSCGEKKLNSVVSNVTPNSNNIETIKPPIVDKTTLINGSVFIVTQGAGNYKLGLVDISVIPEEIIKKYVSSLDDSAEISAKEALENAKQRVQNQLQKIDNMRNKRDALLKSASKLSYFEESEKRDKLVSIETIDRQIIRERDLTDRLFSDVDRSLELLNYEASGERIFNNLPIGIVNAVTDADGKFTLTVDKLGKYAIAAKARRLIGNKTENYFWLIWINTDGKPINVMLSNNNKTDSGSLDSVVKTNVYKY